MAVALIGLTGGIGAGKSTALQALQELGASVLSSDAVVHQLYEGEQVKDAVVERWGEQVAPGGVVDRGSIAKIVFDAPEEREWLESLLWPLVGTRIAGWIQEVRSLSPPPRAAVLEVPLLFESGLDAACDGSIAVVASEEEIAQRTASRSLVGVGAREGRQLSQEQKAGRASFVVENDGSVEDLKRKLSSVLDKLGG
ncbi:MAG TPA: dephospho-CoA kinase [Solirubrobacteraceae bacterium]